MTEPRAEGTDAQPRRIQTDRWELEDTGRGFLTMRLRSFAHFDAALRALDIIPNTFVWRGHARPEWRLESSLDRLRSRSGFAVSEQLTSTHLKRFQRGVRGRLPGGAPSVTQENDWWALGQHYGLATPLLDWSTSPVAAYFAYQSHQPADLRMRCVFGLSRFWCEDVSRGLLAGHSGASRAPVLEFVDPHVHDNARLIAQDGIFTRAPDGVTVDEWVRLHTRPDERYVHLLRIEVPAAERRPALHHLASMRLEHGALFPDVSGAAATANYWSGKARSVSAVLPPRSSSASCQGERGRGADDPVQSVARRELPMFKGGKLTRK
ncbi:MAG: FRG domain-containing protein [Gemmatimonadetes bacterium]|nr:FRG domain-containing protein [Gemmatimonadota bacterium]